MASLVDLVKLSDLKSFLGIDANETKFDTQISLSIPFYASLLTRTLGIDFSTLTDEDYKFLVNVVYVYVGCHLMKTDREFGMKHSGWKAGNSSKNFVRRYKTDYDSWCDFLEELMTDLPNYFTPSGESSGKRMAVSDSYDTPYSSS